MTTNNRAALKLARHALAMANFDEIAKFCLPALVGFKIGLLVGSALILTLWLAIAR